MIGHGSNVQGVETVATYDKSTKEFVICTPHEAAQKCWIGNAASTLSLRHFSLSCPCDLLFVFFSWNAEHGQWTVCFAQLIVEGVNHGVHVFIVRIRNSDGTTCPSTTALLLSVLFVLLFGIGSLRLWQTFAWRITAIRRVCWVLTTVASGLTMCVCRARTC